MRILVGVTGGIAAYKAASVIRGFTELGHEVKVVPTQNALRFIGATTLEALSHNSVDSDLYTDVESVKHIALAQEAELVVIAPASASFIAKYAQGIADDLLLNVLLATKAQVAIAPAMHSEMWQHPATVENIATLKSRGVRIIEPAVGRLTGTDTGVGRLPEPEDIVAQSLASISKQDLVGRSVLIAAGGTWEPIDDVRYIGNRSSGKQGLALAQVAKARGAKVTLIAINLDSSPSNIDEVLQASTFSDVSKLLNEHINQVDALLMPAAISDFRVAERVSGKLHRTGSGDFSLDLVSNPDLIAGVASRDHTALLVGFAAEIPDETQNESLEGLARQKLTRKNLDLVIANDVTNGQVFDVDTNDVLIVTREHVSKASGTKIEVAEAILDAVAQLLRH